jgi:hypothetical protein
METPATLADLDANAGYEMVNNLFEAGALSCLDYQWSQQHDQCVWHHPEKAAALLHRAVN